MTLREALWSLLDKDYSQTANHLEAALRTEYPELYEKLQKDFEDSFGPGCGMRMNPLTEIHKVLEEMLQNEQVERAFDGKYFSWRKLEN